MSRYTSISYCRILVLFPFLAGFLLPAAAATQARVSETYGKLPLHFEVNRGQTDKDVRFLSRGPGYSLYLTANEAVLVLAKPDAKAQGSSLALRMGLVGAAREHAVSGLDAQPGKANYFIGKDPAKWRTNIPTFAKVHYRDVYPGIDLLYYGNQRQLEYDFVVAPGADPKKIVLDFKGADKVQIDAQGDLVLHTAGGDIRQHKPVIYQDIGGVRQEIVGRYVRQGASRVGFQVAAYDRSRPLVIDPIVLAYSTYLGGNGFDGAGGIAVDRDGNAYVTGSTNSINFPTTLGTFETAFHGPAGYLSDAFVTKFDPTGSALVYSTYLGGSNLDEGSRIAVDATGNVYVTGITHSTDFPTTTGAFQTTTDCTGDAYVTKLNPSGSALVYSTYLGGSGHEGGSDIAVDTLGNAYVTGSTNSLDFPTTLGAFQPVFAGGIGPLPGPSDAYVTKLNPTGSGLVYSTYLGGSGNDFGSGIATDADGNAYVTGRTDSRLFPTTPGAFQPVFALTGGGLFDYNAFVTKLDPTGCSLVYSTYLGGNGHDQGLAIAIDRPGNAYVTGSSVSTNFPTTPGAFQPVSRGAGDGFVTKLDPTGSSLVYSTYLGGTDIDAGYAIAVGAAGDAYVTGITFSIDFPTTADVFQPALAGGADSFVTKLNPSGSGLVYSTYLGGSSDDYGPGIAVDAVGSVYVSGKTNSTNFPTANAFQSAKSDSDLGTDAFIAKIVEVVPPPASTP
jgi:beta-propeller repeat-containing protein